MKKYLAKKYYAVFIIFGILATLLSPAMNIKEMEISGLDKLEEDELTKYMDEANPNILLFSPGKAVSGLKQCPYIKDAQIKKDYKNRNVYIDIEERKVSGYVKFNNGNYLYVDKDGMVLEVKSYFTEKRPVVEGLDFMEFVVGESLNVENKGAFRTMVLLAHLFEKFDIEHDIIRVDLSDEEDIHFYYGKIDILIGDASELDLKVRKVMAILPEIEDLKERGGYLHAEDVAYQWFEYAL